jgi:hypothetical protein
MRQEKGEGEGSILIKMLPAESLEQRGHAVTGFKNKSTFQRVMS